MSHPMPSSMRPLGLGPSARSNDPRDFPDLSATVRPPPAPISTAANPTFRNAVSLPSSPTLGDKFINTCSRVVRLLDLRSTPTNLLWNLFTHACSQVAYSFDPPRKPQSSSPLQRNISSPTPMLAPSDSSPRSLSGGGGIWAVFSSHEDARAALNLGCDIFSVSPALESDLASLPGLKRLNLGSTERDIPPRHGFLPPLTIPDMSPSPDIYSTGGPRYPFPVRSSGPSTPGEPVTPPYTMSSNPPNPKTSFRAGDWMCSAPNCSAHNFQRNMTCIVCGRARSGGAPPLPADQAQPPNYPLANPSPRFASRYQGTQSAPHTPLTTVPSPPFIGLGGGPPPLPPHVPPQGQPHGVPAKAPPPQYPPLTPSGRALSVGGRVRNISRDPFAPCVMYWPDNEPLPETCQIRPIDSALMTYPPIINTGNKGAAEKQPGDWVCGKCNYHNWRRRKVCQTCFPYAEGNGDSISATVQAERIALLANVLTQFNALDLDPRPSQPPPPAAPGQPPNSAPPFQVRTNFGMPRAAFAGRDSRDSSPASEHFPILPPPPFSDHEKDALPIYQTSGGRGPVLRASSLNARTSSGIAASRPPLPFLPGPGPLRTSSPPPSRTLLPSFLQDIVHSPSHSPSSASSSSADLSFDGSSEDAHYASSATSAHSHSHQHQHHAPQSAGGQQQQQQHALHSASARNPSTSSFSSIWRFDGEETKTLAGPSSAGPTPAPGQGPAAGYTRHRQSPQQPGDLSGGPKAASPRAEDATPKSTNDFWQVRYN
ncbi:hypothetical protein BD413DRAFT_668940 [Trametes elegans]|nr:hypothetical protein BD413DRAFT_668940 [Trametes elegans]